MGIDSGDAIPAPLRHLAARFGPFRGLPSSTPSALFLHLALCRRSYIEHIANNYLQNTTCGRWIITVVPSPSRDSTRTVPPWASMILRTI